MKLEELLLNVELQGDITIKVYDYTEDDYIAEFPYTHEQYGRIEELYGGYYIKFIYPENGMVIIEIAED